MTDGGLMRTFNPSPNWPQPPPVGRPDLPRRYFDSGLVDLNQVPREHLASCPQISPDEAHRLADAREMSRRFSIEEAAIYADLVPDNVTRIKEFAIFL